MMRLRSRFIIGVFLSLGLWSCSNDDNGFEEIPERDRGEQAIEDEAALQAYLETHFYNYEEFENPSEDFDYTLRLDSIDAANADKTPLIDSENLIVKTVEKDDIEYKLYILKVREGEGERPTFADSTLVSYRGELLNQRSFDNALTPIWFDLSRLIVGFSQGVTVFKGATGYVQNSDNTVEFNNDYGIGAIFMPSGLGYFSSGQASIPAYSPLVFTINLYNVEEADHDGDGIPSWMEDLNGDENLVNDDSDGDGTPDYSDPDDDGDGKPTREEIIINADGSVEFPDTSGNGIPDYLDPDTFE